MTATIEVGDIGNTNLISSPIRVGRHVWKININAGGPLTLIQSMHDMSIPDTMSDPQYRKALRELERAVSYMRSAVTFAFETPTKRGFESFVGEIDEFFPSARQKNAYRQNVDALEIAVSVLGDVGRKYSPQLHRLLEYWRRGFELGEMWYFSEAYLNYYKILEAMAKRVNTGTNITYAVLKKRFHTDTKFEKRFGFNEKDVEFAAKVFASLGYKKVTVAMFRTMCRIAKVRNHFNVGHTQAPNNKGFYSAIGQFSDDFDLTGREGEALREITRLLILHSLGYTKYWANGVHGSYVLRIQKA